MGIQNQWGRSVVTEQDAMNSTNRDRPDQPDERVGERVGDEWHDWINANMR